MHPEVHDNLVFMEDKGGRNLILAYKGIIRKGDVIDGQAWEMPTNKDPRSTLRGILRKKETRNPPDPLFQRGNLRRNICQPSLNLTIPSAGFV